MTTRHANVGNVIIDVNEQSKDYSLIFYGH